MQQQVSPKFSHDKLDKPSIADLIDVFEDLWQSYLFDQVLTLLYSECGDIASMTLLCSYYESIESYLSGESSQNRSREFFINGFLRIYTSQSEEIQEAAGQIYKHIRCGLLHESMLRYKVQYSRAGSKAFFLTYPKKDDGSLDMEEGAISIIVNPVRMYDGAFYHFREYIKKLRNGDDNNLINCFKQTVNRQWDLAGEDLVIGISEAKFLGNA